MIKRIIGIDPGKNTGFAEYDGEMRAGTTDFWGAVSAVELHDAKETAVIVELPTTKAVWHGNKGSKKTNDKVAVNVGSVIREAELLAQRFIGLGYMVVTVRPQGKKTAEQVKAITGCDIRTNEHSRDAIMLAWDNRYLLKAIDL